MRAEWQPRMRVSGGGSKGLLWLAVALMALMLPGVLAARQSRSATQNVQASAEPLLKVKLGSLTKKLAVKFPDGGQIVNQRGRRVKSLRPGQVFTWEVPEAGRKKRRTEHVGETLSLQASKAILEVNGKKYRGSLQINFSAKGAIVVNHIGIEDYLRGVIGSEIGARAPAETIRAQTVIARTYAYASRGKHGADGADVCDSTHCQVYSGVSAERDTIDPAVAATRGIVMISDGKPIATLYHATCGGMTSDNDKVYGGAPCSYLRRVVCPFCREGSNYRWSRSIGLNELRTALRQERISFEQLRDASIDSPGRMDRVTSLILTTNRGVFKIKGTTVRRLFNLPSTTFVLAAKRLPPGTIAALPVSEAKLPTGYRARVMTSRVSDGAPPQMFVWSAKGLQRSQKPSGGWQALTADLETVAPRSEKVTNYSAAPRSEVLGKLELFGRGYGHQVGLCQSGAIELGKRGWSYRQILALYYSNVALRSMDY